MAKKVVIDGIEYVPKHEAAGLTITSAEVTYGEPFRIRAGSKTRTFTNYADAVYTMDVTNARGRTIIIEIDAEIFRQLAEVSK